MAMTKVAEVVVGSGGSASIEFTNIPQTGKDLLVVTSLRGTTTNSNQRIEFNSSTSSYQRINLLGDGSSVFSANSANQYAGRVNSSSTTSNTFSNTAVYVSNYTSSANKSISVDSVTENNATSAGQEITAFQWANSSAVTSVLVGNFDNSLAQHSTASLYIID